MAFSTRRGRPRNPVNDNDPGTPELRLKHALGMTAEPIDICLAKKLITPKQHWCGLHLRWLYTLRYGAPSLTTQYTDRNLPASPPAVDSPDWREQREREYQEAINLLKYHHHYEGIMRLCIFNEHPAFLNPQLQQKALSQPTLAERLIHAHRALGRGLDLLARQWCHYPAVHADTLMQQSR